VVAAARSLIFSMLIPPGRWSMVNTRAFLQALCPRVPKGTGRESKKKGPRRARFSVATPSLLAAAGAAA
jgi:hypothetical protein